MITRRNFIQKLGLTAIAAGASLNIGGRAFGQMLKADDLFLIPSESMSNPLLTFTSADFTPFINTDFQVRQEGLRRTELLRLIDVKDFQNGDSQRKISQGNSFSLMFYNTRSAKIVQNQLEFSHSVLGKFTLFLAPVNKEPNRYEAIINHQQA